MPSDIGEKFPMSFAKDEQYWFNTFERIFLAVITKMKRTI